MKRLNCPVLALCCRATENAGLLQAGRRVLRMAGAVRPGDDGARRQHSPDGAWDSHARDGRAWPATSRVHVVNAGHDGVYDAHAGGAEKRRVSRFSLAHEPPHAIQLGADAHRTPLLLRCAPRQPQTSRQPIPRSLVDRRIF